MNLVHFKVDFSFYRRNLIFIDLNVLNIIVTKLTYQIYENNNLNLMHFINAYFSLF